MNKYIGHIQRALKTIVFFGFIVLFVVIITAATNNRSKVLCSDIKVELATNNEIAFLDEADLLNIVTDNGQNLLINEPLSSINLTSIEANLEKNPFVANAEVHSNFDGDIRAVVTQKQPIYRVFNNKGVSYYIGETGRKMPLSAKFTPRLIVATGHIPDVANTQDDKLNSDLYLMVEFILADAFWSAMIGQVHVNEKQEFVLYPKIDGLNVEFGDVSRMREKFKNLRIFYNKALTNADWKQYETINLKYKGQIICSKK